MRATDAHLTELMGAISVTDLMRHVRELARWTKHAGEPEELVSLHYLEEQLRGMGYATEVLTHDAYISLPRSGSVEWSNVKVEAISHSFSRSTPAGGVSGPAVFVGRGRAEDYTGLPVDGAVVLVEGLATPAPALEATRRGAVAEIHISPDERLHEMCISSVWGSPSDLDLARLPQAAVVSVRQNDGEAMRRAGQSGTLSVTVKADVDTGWRKTPILIADLRSPGRADAGDPFIVFSGHHDAWYYGAMDNGGANSTMLEVARLCSSMREVWRRGLRLAFWSGHSQGRYSSSTWYADNHWEELDDRGLVHVNIDSTGGRGNTVVSGATSSAELGALAKEALAAQSGQGWAGGRMHRAGDQSFWGIGIPSIFGNMGEQPTSGGGESQLGSGLSGDKRLQGTGWWWHTPEDTLDKIDPIVLVRDTRIYLHVVWRLLTEAVLPLDYARWAEQFGADLLAVAGSAADGFALSPVLDRVERLRTLALELNKLRSIDQRSDVEQERLNSLLIRLSRILVPLDYTSGDRFEHDPALPSGPVPGLRDLARLATLQPGSDGFLFLNSRLARARNRVMNSLALAIAELEAGLGEPRDAGAR
jgi:N-acetylated-alpha-linked acidic dipeptidase